MSLGFKSSRKNGIHFELAKFAANRLGRANLLQKGRSEREYEHAIVANLQSSPTLRKYLITQLDDEEENQKVEKITQAHLFGFKHRPDTTIGNDGTAIEIKVITNGPSVRDLLGQGIIYRMGYRFVILVLIDNTPDRQIVRLCGDKNSSENSLLRGLANEFNIFTIIGPAGKSKNLVFI